MEQLLSECLAFLSTSDKEGDASLRKRYNNIQDLFYVRAIKMGHLEILRFLLDRDNSYLNKRFGYVDTTLLSIAIKYRQIDIIRFLIEKGANVNMCSYGTYTSLEYACKKQYYDIISLLLKFGANPNGKIGIPLYIAANNNDRYLVQQLLDAGANPNIKVGYDEEFIYESTETTDEIKQLIINYQTPLDN
jgi:ankyrin repeat protein